MMVTVQWCKHWHRVHVICVVAFTKPCVYERGSCCHSEVLLAVPVVCDALCVCACMRACVRACVCSWVQADS